MNRMEAVLIGRKCDYRRIDTLKELNEILKHCRQWGCYKDVRDACVDFLERNDVIKPVYDIE